MGAHLRNGRNISAEQQQRNLEHLSKFPISPAAAERLRRVREQLAASTGNRENLLPSGSDRFQSRSIAEGHQSVRDLPSSSIEQINPKQHTSYLAGLINELDNNENTRFEQIKRRLGDMTQNVNTLNNKLNSDPASEHHKAPPPHLHYNNPFLNQAHIPPPASQENPAHFQPSPVLPPQIT
ncbi:hypothetical protein MJO28_015569 [Puccinia striiformis f. sp. tritici]|uniref:Uncharacterized protein n=1 Tax=Puccinia striiformis f. sp. tritici TaxID=168172 RepID=A0ACC0DP30_9BASI|nr:hypothetical protein MJO28_015569 [Puccinia striiformis f. sp. tritici]